MRLHSVVHLPYPSSSTILGQLGHQFVNVRLSPRRCRTLRRRRRSSLADRIVGRILSLRRLRVCARLCRGLSTSRREDAREIRRQGGCARLRRVSARLLLVAAQESLQFGRVHRAKEGRDVRGSGCRAGGRGDSVGGWGSSAIWWVLRGVVRRRGGLLRSSDEGGRDGRVEVCVF